MKQPSLSTEKNNTSSTEHLSPETPSAERAIKIIEEVVEKTSPEMAAYLVYPNIVLTLAGARAMADGIFYSDDQATRDLWLKEAKGVMKTLSEVCPMRFQEAIEDRNVRGEDMVSLQFLTETGLAELGRSTNFLPDDFTTSSSDPETISSEIISAIEKNGKATAAGIREDYLEHVRVGVLLGYPDKAITSGLLYWQDEDDDNFRPKLVDADIRGANYYHCPQPVYDYSRDLVGDPDIRAHEQLWSKILQDFYTSDFFQKLKANPDFDQKIKALTKY